ncbi:hypothetical protein SLA2020_369490 [Shorea laevis]
MCGSLVDLPLIVGVMLVLEKMSQTPPSVVETHQTACGSLEDSLLVVGAELVPAKYHNLLMRQEPFC